VLTLLRGGEPLTYLWNAAANAHLDRVKLSATARGRLSVVPCDQELSEAELTKLLTPLSPWVGPRQRDGFREALALAAYQAQTAWPVVQALVCDDAAQYRQVTDELALCWVHEGRHYAKLLAHVPLHRQLLESFQDDFWDYYRELLAYRKQPTPEAATRLEQAFDPPEAGSGGRPASGCWTSGSRSRGRKKKGCCWCCATPSCRSTTTQPSWRRGGGCASETSASAHAARPAPRPGTP
jgi:hypothetical protein